MRRIKDHVVHYLCISLIFQVVSHEIGHNLGMLHDFTDPNPGTARFCQSKPSELCTDTQGVMDYFQVCNTIF